MNSPKVTLVTGGSRGIGKATALLLAERGHRLCINYRQREAEALAVVETIRERGGTAIAIRADISDEQQIIELFTRIDQQLGPITGLVNNAARLFTQATVEQLAANRLHQLFAANISGSILCAREAVKRMSTLHQGQGGAIVNVSSAASRLGSPFEYTDYAASKGAIDTFTRGLSLEVAGAGIRVNAVRPGFIYTEMHAQGGEAGRVDRLGSQLPMGRGGQPIEVAYAIAWLLSDEASYVTGSFIDLAGGR